MRKVLACCLVVGALVVCRDAGQAPVVAQGKKDVKKTTGGVIEIGEGKDGKFRFFVRDSEGKLLAMSGPGGFETSKAAQAAVDELKSVIGTAKVTTAPKKKVADKDKDE